MLLSDQNPYTIKIATYDSISKNSFIDRKEFSGSILEIYDKTIEYLKLNSLTFGLIDNSLRKDVEEFPEFILREIVINSLIHRDYSTITSNIINIYKNKKMEFISYGSLYGNITIEDVLAGLSASRNPFLQSIFMRLKRVEAIGSGLRRVNNFYIERDLKIELNALPSSFIVTLPRITLTNCLIDSNSKIILDYLNNHGEITRKIAEQLINKEKTATATILNNMVNDKILSKIGNGPSTKYVIR